MQFAVGRLDHFCQSNGRFRGEHEIGFRWAERLQSDCDAELFARGDRCVKYFDGIRFSILVRNAGQQSALLRRTEYENFAAKIGAHFDQRFQDIHRCAGGRLDPGS